MSIGQNFIKEFNDQQSKIFNNFMTEVDYLDSSIDIPRMYLRETILLESNYLRHLVSIMEFEKSVDHIVTKYLPDYRSSNELINEGVMSDIGNFIGDWYDGMSDMEKQDFHVDLGVTAVGAIGGLLSYGTLSVAAGVTGITYYLYRAVTTYNQGYKFEAVIHLISAILSIGQAFPAAGTGVTAAKTLIMRALASPLQTLGKMLVKSQGLVKSSAEGLTSNIIKMFRPGHTTDKLEKAAELLKTNKSYVYKATELLKNKLKGGPNSPFVKMLNEVMSAKGQKFDISTVEKLADQADMVMRSLIDSTGPEVKRGERKFEIVKNLIEASEKANMTDVASARNIIDAIDRLKGSSKKFLESAERLNIQQGKFDDLIKMTQKETLSQDEAAKLYRELIKSRDLYEETISTDIIKKLDAPESRSLRDRMRGYDYNRAKFDPDDSFTMDDFEKRKKSGAYDDFSNKKTSFDPYSQMGAASGTSIRRVPKTDTIEVVDLFGRKTTIRAPGSFYNQLKYMDEQILALEKRFDLSQEVIDGAAPQIKRQAAAVLSAKRALRTSADEFTETFFDIAQREGDAFAKEFCQDLSNISGLDVIGPLQAKPGEPLKLAVRKKEALPFEQWVKTGDTKQNLVDDYLKGTDIKKSGLTPEQLLDVQDEITQRANRFNAMDQAAKDSFTDALVRDNDFKLKQIYAESEDLVEELNFDQFIYEHVRSKGSSLHEVLQDNAVLNKMHEEALSKTGVLQDIKKDFIAQTTDADRGTAAYLAKQKMYDDYFYMMDTGRKKTENITDFDRTISNFHYYLSEQSILAEFWKDSIPNRYTLFIKKLGFNLLSDPVVEFINDDFTSFGELEIIDDALLDSISNAADAAIDMIPDPE